MWRTRREIKPSIPNFPRRDVGDESLITRRGIVEDGLTLYKGLSRDGEIKVVPAAGRVGNGEATGKPGVRFFVEGEIG